jgi:outer membrane protein TolC
LFSAGSSAQSLTLSLGESIALAGDSSLQAFRVKNLYMSNYWEYKAFKAGRLPSLTLKLTPVEYNRRFISRYDSNNDMDVYREQQSLYSSGNLSVSKNLDITGGKFSIDSELGHIRNFGENRQTQFNSIPIRIRYSQSLFGFNSFKWEKKIEPLKYEKAKRQYLYSREEISETVIQYFFNLAVAQREYDLAAEHVRSADTLYRTGQERHKIAAISQADLLTLKLDAVNAQNKLKNAGISLKRAMFAFVSYLNLDKETQVMLHLPERPAGTAILPDAALQYAKENNPNYLAYSQELLEAEREVERTKKSSNYNASLSASIGFNQVADNLQSTYKNPLQQDIVSIGVTIPLMDWGVRKGRANMARNNLNVTRISVQQKIISLEQEILMTVNDFNIQQDLISSAEEAMNLADMAYNITKERFIIGKADINSLTLSQERQNSAQISYLSAIKNFWMSYYKLRRLTLFDFEKDASLSFVFDEVMNVRQ